MHDTTRAEDQTKFITCSHICLKIKNEEKFGEETLQTHQTDKRTLSSRTTFFLISYGVLPARTDLIPDQAMKNVMPIDATEKSMRVTYN